MDIEQQKLVELCRSFSQKVSLPHNQYEMRDFFMSAKCECAENEAEKKSAELFKMCQKGVEKSIKEYLEEKSPIISQQKKKFIVDSIPEGLEEKKFIEKEAEREEKLPIIIEE